MVLLICITYYIQSELFLLLVINMELMVLSLKFSTKVRSYRSLPLRVVCSFPQIGFGNIKIKGIFINTYTFHISKTSGSIRLYELLSSYERDDLSETKIVESYLVKYFNRNMK